MTGACQNKTRHLVKYLKQVKFHVIWFCGNLRSSTKVYAEFLIIIISFWKEFWLRFSVFWRCLDDWSLTALTSVIDRKKLWILIPVSENPRNPQNFMSWNGKMTINFLTEFSTDIGSAWDSGYICEIIIDRFF